MDNENLTNGQTVIESAVSIIQSALTSAGESVVAVLDGVKTLADNDVVETIQAVAEYTGDTIEALKIIKKIYDLPTMLFMLKFERYCRGLVEIPLEKRQSYLEKTKAISRKKESLFILNILNKIEDESKIDMTVRLLEAKLDGKINETTYRRLLIMTGETLYSDLCYMKENISHDNFSIKDDAQEGLLGHGWIRPVGQGWGTIGGTESENLFAYNIFAKWFCQIVFRIDIDITPPSDNGTIKIATEEQINDMF